MTELDDFLMLLHPNKTLDEVKLDPRQLEHIKKTDALKSETSKLDLNLKNDEEIKKKISRKEKRFNDRKNAKKNNFICVGFGCRSIFCARSCNIGS